jgi:hypothetical protein
VEKRIAWLFMQVRMKGSVMTQTPRYKQALPRRFLSVLGYLLVVTIVIGSFLPGRTKKLLGTEPYSPVNGHTNVQHRLFHFGSFGATALVFLLLANDRRGEVRAAALVFLLGCIIEPVQWLTGLSAVFEWWDVRDDLYAVAGAFLLIQLMNTLAHVRSG